MNGRSSQQTPTVSDRLNRSSGDACVSRHPLHQNTADRVTHESERERVKKSPVFADEYRRGFESRPASCGRNEPGTGDDLETRRVLDIVFFFLDLPARNGDVRKYRQSG